MGEMKDAKKMAEALPLAAHCASGRVIRAGWDSSQWSLACFCAFVSSTSSTERAPAPLPIMLGMLETSRHRPSTQAMALPEMYAGIEDAAIVDEKRITMAMWLLGGGRTDAGEQEDCG